MLTERNARNIALTLLVAVLVIAAFITIRNIYMRWDEPRSFAEGKVIVYFQPNMTVEEAYSIIESYNLTIEYISTIRISGYVMYVVVEVPPGEEDAYVNLFKSNPKVTDAQKSVIVR